MRLNVKQFKSGRRSKTSHSGGADKSGKERFVLFIGDEGGILVYMHGVKVVRRLFAPSPQPSHTEAMIDLVRSHPAVPVHVLADVLDQQYVRQTFPPVSQFSVGGLVKRRLGRDFQTEDLKGSIALGRDKTGRKEWHYLLIALAKTPLVSAWLDLLVELPNEFGGVYLAPIEATNYLAMLHKAKGNMNVKSWQLMVSHNKVSGFRQIVAQDGKLVFTRVSQAIDDGIPAVIAGNIEQEILNTLEYLRRLGFQDNTGLDATVIVAQDVKDLLDIKRFGFSTNYVLSPLDVADALDLEQAALSADRFGDVVMASAFAVSKKRVLRFSTAYADALAKLYLGRKAVRAGMFLFAGIFIALSLQSVVLAIGANTSASRTDDARRAVQGDILSLRKLVNGLDKDVAFKTAVVGTYGAYLKDIHPPLEFARELAPLLGSEERIVSYEWRNALSSVSGNTASASPAGQNATLPLEMKVEFSFDGQYQDIEALTRSAKTLVSMLQEKMPRYEVSTDVYPWLKDSEKNMEVSLDQVQVSSPIPEGKNKLTVVFRGPRKEGVAKNAAAATPPLGMPR